MATDFRSAAHIALYDAIAAAIAGGSFTVPPAGGGAVTLELFDHIPFQPEGRRDGGTFAENMPCIQVGDNEVTPWDTDDTRGAYVTATLHVWSRYKGRKQVDAILDTLYGLLHRATLARAGYKISDCLFEFSDVFTEPDGQVRHGVIRFRLTIQEA